MAQQDAEAGTKTGQIPLKQQFAELACDLADILGTSTYEGVLYSEKEAREKVPLDGQTDRESRWIPGIDVAQAHANYVNNLIEEKDAGCQRVSVVQEPENMITNQGMPNTSVVFFDAKIVRGKQISDGENEIDYEYDGEARMKGYQAVVNSNSYEVRLENADYETGDVTITVDERGGASASLP